MSSETTELQDYGWAILELMGHRRLGGTVREQLVAGIPMLRIDIPAAQGEGFTATQFYGASALYCLTPTTEEIARAVAAWNQPTPVQRWELPTPRDEEQSDDDSGEWD